MIWIEFVASFIRDCKTFIALRSWQNMMLNCFRINCIIEKLNSLCYWFSNTFSLYDLFETWSFIRDYETSIASRYWHDYSNQLFYQKIAFTEHVQLWTRHDIECKMRYWISNIFFLYDLIWICCTICSWFDCDLIMSVIVSLSMFMCFDWCKNSKCLFLISEIFFFLLAIISSKSKTTSEYILFSSSNNDIFLELCMLCYMSNLLYYARRCVLYNEKNHETMLCAKFFVIVVFWMYDSCFIFR